MESEEAQVVGMHFALTNIFRGEYEPGLLRGMFDWFGGICSAYTGSDVEKVILGWDEIPGSAQRMIKRTFSNYMLPPVFPGKDWSKDRSSDLYNFYRTALDIACGGSLDQDHAKIRVAVHIGVKMAVDDAIDCGGCSRAVETERVIGEMLESAKTW